MKVSLITPMDIRYSYRGTEVDIYEYAKFMQGKGIAAEVLVPDYSFDGLVERSDYGRVYSLYKNVPKRSIKGRRFLLPFNYGLYVYSGLPEDSIVYFAYSIYDHIFNIIRKPRGQKYIIAAHSMHIKHGHIIEGHQYLEWMLNSFMRFVFSTKEAKKNIYHHVITNAEGKYLEELGIPKKNIFYIPTFVESGLYSLAKNKSGRLHVVHIGGVNKDASRVVAVINALQGKQGNVSFDFCFIGDKQPRELSDLIKANKNVHCLRNVTDIEKAKVLKNADVIIVPAVETFSRAMLEGMSSGLYVIASSKNPAAWEMQGLGANVYIAEHEKIEDYVKFLMRLYKLKSSRSDFYSGRIINRRIAIERFDKRVILREMVRMFINVDSDN